MTSNFILSARTKWLPTRSSRTTTECTFARSANHVECWIRHFIVIVELTIIVLGVYGATIATVAVVIACRVLPSKL